MSATIPGTPPGTPPRLDRRALVAAHDVVVRGVLPASPLSVGNGRFATTVDVTGLHTFPQLHPLPDAGGGPAGSMLGTLAEWAWHSDPDPAGFSTADAERVVDTAHGPAVYVDMTRGADGRSAAGLSAAEAHLRANPHRFDLFRAGLTVDGRPARPHELRDAGQRLDLWSGTLTSRVDLAGRRFEVTTAAHPHADALAVRVRGDLTGIGVRVGFSAASPSWNLSRDDTRPGAHRTDVRTTAAGALVHRTLDATRYRLGARTDGSVRVAGAHAVDVVPSGTGTLDLVLLAAPGAEGDLDVPGAGEVLAASSAWWEEFWTRGAAVDVTASRDPRAGELQRRIVLSQHLTAVHSAGTLPPAETGLLVNSWRGRGHLEMHPWHAAHFPLWGRADLLERSLPWYERVLPRARRTAHRQGLPGARWPKQVTPDGEETPSDIGPFLLWQQPHPVQFAELLRRSAAGTDREAEVLRRWVPLVAETARFAAALPVPGPDGRLHLPPPLVPAQESWADVRERAADPSFELAQWRWCLRTAAELHRRAGLVPDPSWERVAERIAAPVVRDGVLAALDLDEPLRRTDHPSMLGALGVVPDTGLVDPAVVRASLHDVLADWDWASAWGWDFPATAMTAARVGEPGLAVDVLLAPHAKNHHLPSGHNHQSPVLPAYLPGNGGLLAAVALMAGGWDGDGGRPAPGFPDDGSWDVRAEGLVRSP
ncbi:hypothetical protein [Kineococcus terrestris]|uniref:hypothetical protein n=1 Tax=Kineococcus terrestris TaxID=2044856 RepID=UPI0034DB3DA5